ncbi:hypothetical protein PFISCL1PPCAC_7830 [Pristionchus fissidentatus]|uniref:GTP cyclohydrolase 1 feedback regulatory protein n=1 Tax=Pristionchus fissidentatus TaxID=1538716 RepID=A0AAV5VBB3_9BILA|nr:hypothetical protein PFISCL1PPCAC_7830 [Pristionchus fissidentatus]
MLITGCFDGETRIGKNTDPELMACLGAKKGTILKQYTTSFTPTEVLNRLEARGWAVVAMSTGPGTELYWTLHKDDAATGYQTTSSTEKTQQFTFAA